MLNRRILRIKAFETLYSYAVTGRPSLAEAQKQLDESCESVRDLYLFMLALVPALSAEALSRIEAQRETIPSGKGTADPNMKFAGNALSSLLADDPDFRRMLEKKDLSWEQYDLIVKGILGRVRGKEYFSEYLASPRRSLSEDCALFSRMFEEDLLDDDALDALLVEKSVFWAGDLSYVISQCCRTFGDLSHGKPWHYPELYQSEEILRRDPSATVQSDRDFVHKLFRGAYCGYEKYFSLIKDNAVGWESDRLFCTDTALIALGLAETEAFPDIPRSVTINEYVEISKHFCTPKSSAFVNGLLDKLSREHIKQ